MKLIYVSNARIPTEKAHGVQIMKMCEAFSKEDVEVELVVPRRRTFITNNPFEYYEVEENFNIKRLPTIDLVGVIPKFGFWLESIVFSLFALFYVWRCDVDVVYSRDKIPLWFLSFVTGNIYWEPHVGSWDIVVRRVLKKVEGLICITRGGRDYFKKRGVATGDIIVASDAVDLEQFDVHVTRKEARERLGLPHDKKIVMYIGLFDEWKGYRTLLGSARILETIGARVVMVGGGDEQVEKLKKEYPHVHFTGYRPYRELAINQKAADVLIIPNSAKKEVSTTFTSPLKLFAYMASGRPIVATNIPSLKEILKDGKNAVLVGSDSSENLADGIKRVLHDTKLAHTIAVNAFKDVSKYTWQRRAKNIIKFIRA